VARRTLHIRRDPLAGGKDIVEADRHGTQCTGGEFVSIAIELAKRQITVNCVAPGLIATEMVDENVPMTEILRAIPAQRVGTAEEVAAAVGFLLSADASYVTRQVLAVNGGLC
jgi:3-oxoacyl-[acyl-carrier protein] reductase